MRSAASSYGRIILSAKSSYGPSSASISSVLRYLSKSDRRFLDGSSGENGGMCRDCLGS